MPVPTRAATNALGKNSDLALDSLRSVALPPKDLIWSFRDDNDAYTRATRDKIAIAQSDHVIEIQLVEYAFANTIVTNRGSQEAQHKTADIVRRTFNDVSNLNVTSRKVNLAKRGPHTAALNRLNVGNLRSVSLTQLAKQGKAKWLVDEGIWANIESEIVRSYDRSLDRISELCESDTAAKTVAVECMEHMHGIFERLCVF